MVGEEGKDDRTVHFISLLLEPHYYLGSLL